MKQQPQKTLTPKQISDYQAMNEEFINEGTAFKIDNTLILFVMSSLVDSSIIILHPLTKSLSFGFVIKSHKYV